MLDHFKNDLKKYHQLFNKVRCKAEGLEELIVFSIKSEIDNVTWKPSAHDKEVDIIVNSYKIQIKSGVIQNNKLSLSGHRLGRFNGELDQITEYLNNPISFLKNLLLLPNYQHCYEQNKPVPFYKFHY